MRPLVLPLHPILPEILQELRKCATLYLTTGRRARDSDRVRALTITKSDFISRANARNYARPKRLQPTARHARRNAAMSARIARQTGKKRVKTRHLASRIRPDDTGLQPARHEPISASPGRRTTPPRKKIMVRHLGTFGDIWGHMSHFHAKTRGIRSHEAKAPHERHLRIASMQIV